MQYVFNTSAHDGGYPDTTLALKDMAKVFRCEVKRRGIHNRHKLFDMLTKNPVVEMLITIMQRSHRNIFIQRQLVGGQRAMYTPCLLIH